MGKLTEEHGCTGQPLQKHSQLAGCAEASQLRCFQDGVFFFFYSRSQAVLSIKAPSTELHRLNSTQGTHTNRLQTNYRNIYRCQKTQPNCLPTRLRHRQNLLRSCPSTSYRTNLSAGNTNILPPRVSFSSRFARQGSPEVLPRGRGV